MPAIAEYTRPAFATVYAGCTTLNSSSISVSFSETLGRVESFAVYVTTPTGSYSVPAGSSPSAITISGLLPETTYSFRVYAYYLTGPGFDVSSLSTCTTASAPAPPVYTNPSAPPAISASATSSSSIFVSWSAPTSNGGAPISSYTLYVNGSPRQLSQTNTTITGLLPNTQYSFYVTATNTAGYTSPSSTTARATTLAIPPNTPAAPQTTADNKSIHLSWAAPANNGSTIVDYYIQYSTSSSGPWTTFSDSVSSSTSATVTSLEADTTYFFRIAAVNSAGSSGYSAPSQDTTWSVPNSPTNLSTHPGDQSVYLQWVAPTASEPAILDYILEISRDQGTSWEVYADPVSPDTSIAVSGLNSSTEYQFRVSAVNIVGASSPSNIIQSYTLHINSLSPAHPKPGFTTQITVNGSGFIEGRNLSVNVTGLGTYPGVYKSPTQITFSAPGTGVHNQSYDVSITQDGHDSNTLPLAITYIQPTPTITELSPSTGPTTGGRTVTITGEGFVPSSTVTFGSVAASSVTYIGPTELQVVTPPHTQATVQVVVTSNTVSSVDEGSANTYTYIAPPDAPINVRAAPSNNRIALKWQPPNNDGGASITGYEIQHSSNGTNWIASGTSIDTSFIVNNLSAGIDYFFRVAAVNTVGTGEYSPVVSSQTLHISEISPQISPPEGGDVITIVGSGFLASADISVTLIGLGVVTGTYISPTEIQFIAPPGPIGASFDVLLTQDEHDSNTISGALSYITPPSAPRNLIATPQSNSIHLAWDPPERDGGRPIIDYIIDYSIYNSSSWTRHSDATNPATSATIDNLTPGVDYVFRVTPINIVAPGDPATTHTPTQTLYLSTKTYANNVTIYVTPLVNAARMSSNHHTLDISTNSTTGYRSLISTSSETTNLTQGPHSISSLKYSQSTPGILQSNTWGYRVDHNPNFSNPTTMTETNSLTSAYTWAGIPSKGQTDTLCRSSTPVQDAHCTVWYAIKVSPDLPSGNYTNTIIYTSIAE